MSHNNSTWTSEKREVEVTVPEKTQAPMRTRYHSSAFGVVPEAKQIHDRKVT
jgi:hypothetical protein